MPQAERAAMTDGADVAVAQSLPTLRPPASVASAAPPQASRAPLPVPTLLAALAASASSATLADGWPRLALALTGAVLLAAALIQAGLVWRARARSRILREALGAFVEGDGAACFVADAAGAVLGCNRAGRAGGDPPPTLAVALGAQFASPDALLFRLQSQARQGRSAHEDVVTRRGHLRLSVHCADPDTFLWRIEDLGDRAGAGRAADALSLPMLTAGPGGTILFANDAFRRLVGGRPRHLDRLFLDGPVEPGRIHRVEGAAGAVECLVAQVSGPGGRREIYLLPSAAVGARVQGAGWSAIEDLPVPLLKLSRAGLVQAANRHARALLPMPVGAGTRLSDLLEGLGRPVADWIADVAEGRGNPGPQFLRGAGAHQDTFLRVALSLAGPPDDLHLVAVLDDVTEMKSLEAQFVQSQKMQALGQLAGGVAHDFNNLLTAISGHCDLLLLRRDQGDPEYADLVQIRQNVNRAASLVGQLLAFSRKQTLQLETLDLRGVLSELTHLLNRLVGERVRLTLDHEPTLPHVRADKRQLEQVIMNLVVNARDAMPDGGEIRILTEERRLDEPWVRDRATVPPGAYAVVRVVDEGTGIPPDRLPKIFEPFYTTKKLGEGTGLGLSTAYGIVKQTGGYIFVDSEVGRGTTFSLWFPAREAPPPPAAAPGPAAPAPRRSGGVVLLVEDEAPVRAFASRALRLRGHQVIEAESAEVALAILSDPTVHVDLFVTDVIMPGKDGLTWVREALAQRPGTRVVFVSGYAEETFAEQRAVVPGSVFLPKPFSLTDLTNVVAEQMR